MLNPTTSTPLFLLLLLSLSTTTTASSDTLAVSASLSTNTTLTSSGHAFELGFFTSGNRGKSFYLGIWFYGLPVKTIVWVANRDSPAWSSSASLTLSPSGKISLVQPNDDKPIWSSSSSAAASNPVLQLLDSGNLVVREAGDTDPDHYIWQSFDHPTDTLLPGQKLGWDNTTGGKNAGLDRYLTSWNSLNDPSTGNYSFRMNRSGDPEAFILKSGTERMHRSGPWVGLRFSGVPEMKPTTDLNFTFDYDKSECYYSYSVLDTSTKYRVMMDPDGTINRYVWVTERMTWNRFWYAPKDQCDEYLQCGPYGVCNSNNLVICGCGQGFEPRNPKAWAMRYWLDGCVRKTRLECGTDGFAVLSGMKLPETGVVVVDQEKTLEECGEACQKDCNCTAYANWEVMFGVGKGCIMWRQELLDLRSYGSEGGQDLYVRLAASDLGVVASKNGVAKSKKLIIFGVAIPVGAALLVIAVAGYFAYKRKHNSTGNTHQRVLRTGPSERSQEILLSGTITSGKRDLSGVIDITADDLELPLFDFDALAVATNGFSDDNKIGQGGFGRVYKGVFADSEDIAVKRLSRESGQGGEEFMNELKLIAKLQHRNLVRLLGCCVDKDEKMLVYEYMPNKSLHSVLFHKERRLLLDWQRRFNIICGIARGLLYLHHDSRLRIVHRDLKASNVLLDQDMKPKISDFGMARIFGEDEMESSNTRRIVGTYGYMSPEYAMDGVFSIKSDVFSFGVLILEIITGKKNRGFYHASSELNLLGHAWKMWKEGKGTELLDPSLGDLYSVHEVLRCIQVGLLCVQERPEERPTMPTVLLLLSSDSASLPRPKVPGFCLTWKPGEENYSCCLQDDQTYTVNQVTITMVDGR